MKVVTVITEEMNFGFNLLKLSCALNNLDLVVLVSKGQFSSNRIKDELLADYLEESGKDEIIFFTDGNDAIFMTDEKEIMSKFDKTGSDLIFSAEVRCWPDDSLASQYPVIDTTPYKFLNSGGFLGKAGVIKELLDDHTFDSDSFLESNQIVWTKKYLKNTDKILLDTKCEIFCTFSPQIGNNFLASDKNYYSFMDEWFQLNFAVESARLFNKFTQTKPCHAHFNGNSKWLLFHNHDIVYDRIPNRKHPQYFYQY